MSRFGPDPQAFFDAVYRETAPWDVGGAQPALSDLLAAHPPTSPILDVGCGTGELAITLAVSGLLAMIALPSVRKSKARWATEEATQQFVSDVAKAQSLAIKANRPVTVKRVGQTGYRVDGGTTRLLPDGVEFVPGSPDSVRFVSFGPPTPGASTFTLRGESRTITVSINAAGRISRCELVSS